MVFIFFAQKFVQEISIEYSKKNIFASSYTLFIEISENQNRLFDNSFFRHDMEESRGSQFRDQIM